VVTHFATYYPGPRDVDEVIAAVGLLEKRQTRVRHLSGGQRRRLDVALGIVGRPELLFLDEPTTGFDPSARRRAWEVVASLRELGKTIFLTTHYMEEAQALADRVAIIASGAIVAEGSPAELSGRGGTVTRISFRLPADIGRAELPERVIAAADGESGSPDEVLLRADDPVPVLNELTAWALERRIELASLEVRQPNLEDVYLELTAAGGSEAAAE